MSDISLKRSRKQDDDDDKDDDDDDDDEDIVIIENPKPKPKPPLIILCETSDDEEELRESRDDISLDDGVARPDVIEIGSEPEGDPILSNKTKATASNISPLPDYIPLECSPGSSSSAICPNNELDGLSAPKVTCPECRAKLFSIKMLRRHIQFRHPNIVQYNTTTKHENTNCQKNGNTSPQRLKLTPLRSPISSISITSTSNTSTCTGTLTRNDQELPKIAPLPSLVHRRTGGVSQENKVTATSTSTTTISGTSMDSNKKTCEPIRVVIYSPNSEQDRNDRYVQISPLSTDKQNKTNQIISENSHEKKTADVIELFDSPCRDPAAVIAVHEATKRNEPTEPPPCKRKRQDPLLLLVEDDDQEQDIFTRPARVKEKKHGKRTGVDGGHTCNVHKKTFSTRNALLQHYQAKHQNDTTTTKNMKPNKSYSLRSRNNILPIPSSTPPSMDKLKAMKHIVMIDIDNWQKIFESDLTFSPSTFVWGFHGGSTSWKPPVTSSLLKNLKQMNCFYLHPKCGKSKDAADFALCVQAGKLDVLLPKDIVFTVLSGDKGFNELQNQLSLSKREVHIVNPHNKTIDTVLTILNSIADR